MLLQGHGETPQAADGAPGRASGAGSGGPQSDLQLVGPGHRLQGLQEEEGPVLVLSWSVQRRKVSKEERRCLTEDNKTLHHLLLVLSLVKHWVLWASPASLWPCSPPPVPLSPPSSASQPAPPSAWAPSTEQETGPAVRDAPGAWSPIGRRRTRWGTRSWSARPAGSRWRTSPGTGRAGTGASPAGAEGPRGGSEAGPHTGSASAHTGRRRSVRRTGSNLEHDYIEANNNKSSRGSALTSLWWKLWQGTGKLKQPCLSSPREKQKWSYVDITSWFLTDEDVFKVLLCKREGVNVRRVHVKRENEKTKHQRLGSYSGPGIWPRWKSSISDQSWRLMRFLSPVCTGFLLKCTQTGNHNRNINNIICNILHLQNHYSTSNNPQRTECVLCVIFPADLL